MSLQTINIGSAPNDHAGDSLRTAGAKMNQVLVYSSGTHAWGNADWQAAMVDFVSHNSPSYWAQNLHGDLSYTPPGGGSSVIEIGSNGTIAFSDASTLTPDGSGHLIFTDQIAAGPGLTAWDRYPYEAGIVANDSTMGAKLGIYSMVATTDPSSGGNASLSFGLPNATMSAGIAGAASWPGFEIQYIADDSYVNNEMRWNYIERDPVTGNVINYNANILEVFGDGHANVQGPLNVTAAPVNATYGMATNTGGPVSIALTGSPTTWTNTTGVNVFVMIGGGVVTDIGLNGGGLFTGVSLTGITTLPLQPGESFYVYYTSDPTIYYKPF